MKTLAIVAAALIVGTSVLGGVGYFAFTHWQSFYAEFGPELTVDNSTRAGQAESKLKQAPDAYSRWVALGDVALWKSAEANSDAAKEAAMELLGMVERYQSDWNYGNAIHKANSALGRIALRQNNKAEARKYLLASANSKGSPQMNSFGPNMLFAKEMLAAGEKEAVLDYLARCRKFWDMGQDRLDVWERMIRQDRMPAFGANLLY